MDPTLTLSAAKTHINEIKRKQTTASPVTRPSCFLYLRFRRRRRSTTPLHVESIELFPQFFPFLFPLPFGSLLRIVAGRQLAEQMRIHVHQNLNAKRNVLLINFAEKERGILILFFSL